MDASSFLKRISAASALTLSLLLFSPSKSNASDEPPPCCENPTRFFIVGEYLYWQTHLSDLDLYYGSSNLVEGTANGISFIDSREFDIDPSFDWKSGYRVGCGVELPNSDMSLGAYWTQFKDKGHRSIKGSNGIVNKGSSKVSLEQVDGVIAYACSWPSLLLEPFIGVRYTQINHSVKSHITTSITLLPSTLVTEETNFDDHQHFKGVGPILGVYGEWMAACGLGLYGEGALSVLYGNYKLRFNDSNDFSAPISRQSSFLIHQHLHRFNTNIDLALGIFWRSCIYENTAINLKLGYEFHEYYNLSDLGASRGDLSFHGVAASLEIAF